MVFLDDRADERALVGEAFPDLLTLDSNDEGTWRLITLWGELAFDSSHIDRTRMYQEQALRDAFTHDEFAIDGHADIDSLKRLGLKITIGRPKPGDLKRVAELINRTNQWNLCGTRTTREEVLGWYRSDNTKIFVANAADRFGDMGTVCVAVIAERSECAEIPVFVLSCRVFGYGIESAMLQEINRRCGLEIGRTELIGHFRPNIQNHPCRNMYSDHGFLSFDGVFRWNGTPPLPAVSWAEIRSSS
jgi:FkbH-like protein